MVDGLYFKLLLTWNIFNGCKASLRRRVRVWLKKAVSSSLSHESFYLRTPSFCVRWLPWASQEGPSEESVRTSSRSLPLLFFLLSAWWRIDRSAFQNGCTSQSQSVSAELATYPGFPWLPGAVLLLCPSSLHYSISAEVWWCELVSLCLSGRVSILVSVSPLKNSRMEKKQSTKKKLYSQFVFWTPPSLVTEQSFHVQGEASCFFITTATKLQTFLPVIFKLVEHKSVMEIILNS